MTCAPSEDSDQPKHPPSLIRVFAVRMNIPWVLSYPFNTSEDPDQIGHWADPPSLIWVFAGCSEHFVCFVMMRHIYIEIPITWSNSWFGRLGLMVMLSHCQFHVASNSDYRRAQSVLSSTDDFNFIGLIPRLILGCHILSILLSFPSRDARHIWHTLHPSYFWKRLLNGILK